MLKVVALFALMLWASSPAIASVDGRCEKLVHAFSGSVNDGVTASGLRYSIGKTGGKRLVAGNVAIGYYTVCFENGKFIETNTTGQPGGFTVGAKELIRGVEEGFRLIGVGGEAMLFVPYNLAYGEKARPGLPARSNLLFDIRLVDIKNVALSTLLQRAYNLGGIPSMKTAYARYLATGFAHMYAAEDDLDGLGYRLLVKQHLPNAAVVVLALNATRFPKSWNAQDSLGYAYQKSGDVGRAIASYRRALQLNPSDKNAKASLKKLVVQ